MEHKIWYSVINGGDGSAYPVFMESEKLCEIDQKYMDEGWGEDCTGCLVVESDSPIIVKGLVTIDTVIQEIGEELAEDYNSEREIEILNRKLLEVQALRKEVDDI